MVAVIRSFMWAQRRSRVSLTLLLSSAQMAREGVFLLLRSVRGQLIKILALNALIDQEMHLVLLEHKRLFLCILLSCILLDFDSDLDFLKTERLRLVLGLFLLHRRLLFSAFDQWGFR